MTTQRKHTLSGLLDGMEHAARKRDVSVSDLIREFGDRAITPFILVVALLLVSPLSGIPGTPTVAALLIVTLSVQALAGRRRLWLPKFLMRQHVAGRYLRRAVDWMRGPCAFLDRHTHIRLQFLTRGVMRALTLVLCVVIPIGWPFLEILPLVSSFGAATVALLALGLFTRDGIYVLFGYLMIALTAGTALSIWMAG